MKKDSKKPIPFPMFLIFAILLLGGSFLMKKINSDETAGVSDETAAVSDEATAAYDDSDIQTVSPESVSEPGSIDYLDEAEDADQAIVVISSGTSAKVSMYEKENGNWKILIETNGYVGEDGVGAASETSSATPEGVYNITKAFGIMPDPGCAIGYLEVDDSYYWVDDIDSKYYNRLVSTDDVDSDWDSAEHINAVGSPYNYILAFDYNAECIPGKGSAFFLHCTEDKPTEGCITIPENDMITILRSVHDGCVIIIH